MILVVVRYTLSESGYTILDVVYTPSVPHPVVGQAFSVAEHTITVLLQILSVEGHILPVVGDSVSIPRYIITWRHTTAGTTISLVH